MNFLVQFGVGLIMKELSGGQQAAQQAEMQQMAQEQQAQLQAQMAEQQEAMAMAQGGDPFAPPEQEQPQLANAPPFPDQAAANLQTLQSQHGEQLANLSDQFLSQQTALKSQFLAENHLAVETPEPTPDEPSPQPQVALDDEGKPRIEPGPEQPVHKEAREDYEADQKSTLSEKHADEQQKFVANEKDNVQSFLQDNRPDLGNPAVQGELHKMLAQSQKRALNLTTNQETESLKHDAYTPEMVSNVDNYMNAKTSLQDNFSQVEENSDDAKALYQHQQDLGALLQQQKDELSQTAQEQTFIKGPIQFGAATTATPTDVATILPPYLANALYGMGIYQV